MPEGQSGMPSPVPLVAFAWASDDPLAAEHAAVAQWVRDALRSLNEHLWYRDVDLKTLPSGQALLDATPDEARRYVLAAVIQTQYWDERAHEARAQAENESQRNNPHLLPGWNLVWGRRCKTEAVVAALMRRALPFEAHDLLTIVQWCNDAGDHLTKYFGPLGQITRALERLSSKGTISGELADEMRKFAAKLRASHDKAVKKLATVVEQICAAEPTRSAPIQARAEVRPAARKCWISSSGI